MTPGWTAGPWMAAAKPSSVVGWPVVAPPHGRMICNMAYVSPSAERSEDADVRAFYAETQANAHLIAAAPALYAMTLRAAEQFEFYAEQHAAKGTADAEAKASVNRVLAAQCRAALASTVSRG